MKTIYKISLFIIVILSSNIIEAQRAQLRKAEKAYDQFAYIDAQEIYLKVVEDGYTSAEIFKRLGNTYYFNSDYKNAAIWYERLINEFPEQTEPEYYFRAAQSLKSIENYTKSNQYMNEFAARGGENRIVLNFKSNPDYLDFITSKDSRFVVEKAEVNSAYSDFGPSFYNGKIVFASASGLGVEGRVKTHDWSNQPFFNLYVADMSEEGKLSGVKQLTGDINTKFHESSAVFTKDGETMYFTRNNFIDGRKGRDRDRNIRLKIYKATKVNDAWTNIVELPFNSDTYSVAHPALSVDEKRLYFSSNMPGTMGQSDLWYVDILDDNQYGEPVNLGGDLNTEARESFPFISSDNVLYFSTDGRAGFGGLDVFYTPLDENGMPTEVFIMAEPVNSNMDDFGFIIDTETKIGFISSNRGGDRGSLDDDIYRILEVCEITLTGVVTDEQTGELLPGALVTLLDSNNTVLNSVTVGDDAVFSFTVDCDTRYSVRGSMEDFESMEKVVNTPDKTSTVDLPLELKRIGCHPNDLGCRLTLQPIYFDFDKHNIRPDAAIELAKILAAMREYPELIIHIESHTDSRGTHQYNEQLSERRAQSTMKWLIDQGISKERLSAKGYGETRLINECSDGVYCSEEAHQLNRRSMFIIQNDF